MREQAKRLLRPFVRAARRAGRVGFLSDRDQLAELTATVRKLDKRTRDIELELKAVLRGLYLEDQDLPYPCALTARRFRLSSQNEEDGVTLALLKRVGVATRRFVEIGSGSSGGNSGFLALEFGWNGLMIDGAEARIRTVNRRFNRASVTGVAAWVTRENVNDLLGRHGFRGEVDLLSIDIDGNDYWVWEALEAVDPRLVIVEYNARFGPDRAVVVPYAPDFDRHRFNLGGAYYGASLAALAGLAERKGYRLVTTEPRGVNAYFVRNDLAPDVPACSPERAFRVLASATIDGVEPADLYAQVRQAGLPLVEVPPPTPPRTGALSLTALEPG